MAVIIPYLLAFLLGINVANGLTCYNCNSKDSTTCGWGIASFTYPTQECASAGFVDNLISPKCFKLTAENKEGKSYIARGCLPPATIGCGAMATAVGWIGAQTSNGPDGLQNLSCETCETDKCNSAYKLTGLTFVALILSALAFIF